MRLTADVIARSPAFTNCLKQQELDLRGNKIPFIENLGATQDEYDAIDLSDNDIGKLENFPLLKRLRQLFVSNNRITRVAPNLSKVLPVLETLVLINNRIAKLADLSPLRDLQTVRMLALLDNPVAKEPNYRLYVIYLLPNLRFLDFKRIRIAEKREARKIFGGGNAKDKSKTFDPSAELAKPSAEALQAIRDAIQAASSMEEIQRLEHALASGSQSAIDAVLKSVGGAKGKQEEDGANNNGMEGVEATS